MIRSENRVKKESRFWDRYAVSYDKAFCSDDQKVYEYINALIRNRVGFEDDLLDLACGTGLFSLGLLPYVKSLTCIDISPGMIREAKKKIPENEAGNVRFIVGDSYHIDFPDHSFDIVLFCNALHVIRYSDIQCNEIWRVLKPGALLISCVPCYSEFTSFKAKAAWIGYFIKKLLGLTPHTRFLNRREVLEIYEKNGFEIVKHKIIRESWYNGIYIEAVRKE